jgi:DNA-binding response OmpR family regulator
MAQRILVIDDDSSVRATIKLILASQGFDVIGAGSGGAGLTLLRHAPFSFDLLICDVVMPGMDGVKTIKAVLAHKPTLPIIAISGARLRLSGASPLEMFSLAPGLATVKCLQKPFRPRELLAAVTSLLGIAA